MYETKAYVAFKRGSKGVFDQTPNIVMAPSLGSEYQINHKISRETVFYTTNGGKSYQKKDAQFIIYGRNQFTKNKVVDIGSISLDISKFVDEGPREQKLQIQNSKAANTFIIVEWNITTDQVPLDLTEQELKEPTSSFYVQPDLNEQQEVIQTLNTKVHDYEQAIDDLQNQLNESKLEVNTKRRFTTTGEAPQWISDKEEQLVIAKLLIQT